MIQVKASRWFVGRSNWGSKAEREAKYWSTISWDTCSRVGGSHCIFSQILMAIMKETNFSNKNGRKMLLGSWIGLPWAWNLYQSALLEHPETKTRDRFHDKDPNGYVGEQLRSVNTSRKSVVIWPEIPCRDILYSRIRHWSRVWNLPSRIWASKKPLATFFFFSLLRQLSES